MMPVPPLLINQLQVIPAGEGMIIDGSTKTAIKILLSSNINTAWIANFVPGNLYTFIIAQDAIGGWSLHFYDGVHNMTQIPQGPNEFLIQTFVADESGSLFAISAGTYFVSSVAA
jgi:hypothetical protein